VQALRGRGVDVAVTLAPGLQHDILLEPAARDILRSLVEELQKDARR